MFGTSHNLYIFRLRAKMLKFFSNAEIELIPDNILFKNEFGGAVARMKID